MWPSAFSSVEARRALIHLSNGVTDCWHPQRTVLCQGSFALFFHAFLFYLIVVLFLTVCLCDPSLGMFVWHQCFPFLSGGALRSAVSIRLSWLFKQFSETRKAFLTSMFGKTSAGFCNSELSAHISLLPASPVANVTVTMWVNFVPKGFRQEILNMLLIISESALAHSNVFVHTAESMLQHWRCNDRCCVVCVWLWGCAEHKPAGHQLTVQKDGKEQSAIPPAAHEVTPVTAL